MSVVAEKPDVVICRACISECTDYKYLYKQGLIMGEVTTLATLLGYCTSLDFSPEEDFLPSYICSRCISRLAKCYAFKKIVLDANEVLRKQTTFVQEDEKVEDSEMVDVGQHYETTDDVGADELQDLATAAEIKRDMDNIEYVTLTVVEETGEDEEGEGEEVLVADNEQHLDQHDVDIRQEIEIEDEEEEREDELEDGDFGTEEVLVHEINEAAEDGYNVMHSNKSESYEIVSVDDTNNQDDEGDGDGPSEEQVHGMHVRNRTDTFECQDSDSRPVPRRRNVNNQVKGNNADLQCKHCGKQLSNVNSLKYHLQLHSDATPYLCSLCGEGFKTRNAYEGHIIIHDPNNPNTCEICGKSYRQSSSLRTHMLSHTGEKPYQCDICGKGMTQKSGYKKHMLIHSGEKPHTCDICNREFRYSSNLIAHRRCHSEVKPYNCVHCEKCFYTAEQRKRHMVVHSGDKPFPCEVCGKKFKRRPSLTAHRHTHDGATNDSVSEIIEQKVSKSNVVELY